MAEPLCFIGSTFPAGGTARIYPSVYTNQLCEDSEIVRFFCGVLYLERACTEADPSDSLSISRLCARTRAGGPKSPPVDASHDTGTKYSKGENYDPGPAQASKRSRYLEQAEAKPEVPAEQVR